MKRKKENKISFRLNLDLETQSINFRPSIKKDCSETTTIEATTSATTPKKKQTNDSRKWEISSVKNRPKSQKAKIKSWWRVTSNKENGDRNGGKMAWPTPGTWPCAPWRHGPATNGVAAVTPSRQNSIGPRRHCLIISPWHTHTDTLNPLDLINLNLIQSHPMADDHILDKNMWLTACK